MEQVLPHGESNGVLAAFFALGAAVTVFSSVLVGILLIVFLAIIMLFGWVPYVAVGTALVLFGRRRSRMRWFGVGMAVAALVLADGGEHVHDGPVIRPSCR
ncbi:hypothetical protein [Saccharopolyspora flava]|uniref:hypothetical protein n=1 Tax=Saccharopolyspora flava TaxID=95161 RepID=UPI001114ABCA|nr:hypothetical protein [Saccharopolyspora flava]